MTRPDGHWIRRKLHLEACQAAKRHTMADQFRQDRDTNFARILARLATEADGRKERLARVVVKERQAEDVHERAVMRVR